MEYGILSLAPVLIALVLSFVTKDALLSILVGVIVGVVITGVDPVSGTSWNFPVCAWYAGLHLGTLYRGIHRYHGSLFPKIRSYSGICSLDRQV